MPAEKDLYYLAVKVFLRDGDKLLIIKDVFGAWDLPGGRLQTDEFDVPFEQVIERKIKEELGPKIKYTVAKPVVHFRHQRREVGLPGQPLIRIFAVGFEGEYKGGDIQLCDYLEKSEWVDIKNFDPKKYFAGGWLKGVEEYLK